MNVSELPKLTKAQRRALTWIRDREPVGAFSVDGPALHFVRKLERLGFIERAAKPPGLFGFIRYRLTPAGRKLLSEAGT